MSRRLAILIGNGDFKAEPALANLLGPVNDVRLLSRVLGQPDLGGFDVESLVDQESHTLQHALERRLNNAGRDDLVFVYYSGHGKLDSKGHLCLATANTSLGTLKSTSLSLPFVKGLVDDCRSDRIVLVLDCCYSGAASKAFAVRSTVDDQLAATQQLGAGLYILTSSTAVETSREREQEQDGTVLGNFTRCLAEAIESGAADVNHTAETTLADLHSYLERSVRGQTPGHWGFDTHGRIVIAKNPRVKAAALPAEILSALGHPLPAVRTSIVGELERLLVGPHLGLALAAQAALDGLANDDSQRVSAAAKEVLSKQWHPLAPAGSVEAPSIARVSPKVPAPPSLRRESVSLLQVVSPEPRQEAVNNSPSEKVSPQPSSATVDLQPAAVSLVKQWSPIVGGMFLNLALGSLYAWSVFIGPLEKEFGWTRSQSSLVYTIAIVCFAATFIVAGKLQDAKGPRVCAFLGALLVGGGFALSSLTTSVSFLYLAFGVIVGIGNGFGYSAPTPVASKWFPERRGLAVGLMVGAYGAGSAIFGPLANTLIADYGWRTAFQILGATFFMMGLVGTVLLKNPPAGYKVPAPSAATAKKRPPVDLTTREMIRTPSFWALWFAYCLGTTAGQMMISQLVPFMLSVGLTRGTAAFAITIAAFGNAGGRILSGALSDSLGRLTTLKVMTVGSLIVMFALGTGTSAIVAIYVLVAAGYWCYGTQLSVFASTTADFYGTRHLGMNYGALFTAWGIAGFVGPFMAASVYQATGSYSYAFYGAGGLAFVAFGSLSMVRPPLSAAAITEPPESLSAL